MYEIIGICDTNTVYRTKLAEFFLKKTEAFMQVMTFSERLYLENYLKQKAMEILIIEEQIFSQLPLIQAELLNQEDLSEEGGALHVRKVILLADERIELQKQGVHVIRISRYSSCEMIFHLVLSFLSQNRAEGQPFPEGRIGYPAGSEEGCGESAGYTELELEGAGPSSHYSEIFEKRGYYGTGADGWDRKKEGSGKQTFVIGVYSPIHRCGKTSLAVLFSSLLKEWSRSLLICMDQSAGFFMREQMNLSELIYCMSSRNGMRYLQEEEHTVLPYESFIVHEETLSYIPVPVSGEDLGQISGHQLKQLLEQIRCGGDYPYVILDLSERSEGLLEALNSCDIVFMPVLKDCVSKSKIHAFEQELNRACGSDKSLQSKIHKVCLPVAIETESIENYYKELMWSSLRKKAEHLLREYEIFDF